MLISHHLLPRQNRRRLYRVRSNRFGKDHRICIAHFAGARERPVRLLRNRPHPNSVRSCFLRVPSQRRPKISELIPSRHVHSELAFQISEQFRVLGAAVNLHSAVIVGGMDMMHQAIELKKRPHVLIATPGRLVDLIKSNQGEWNLGRVKFLVSPTFAPVPQTTPVRAKRTSLADS